MAELIPHEACVPKEASRSARPQGTGCTLYSLQYSLAQTHLVAHVRKVPLSVKILHRKHFDQ